MISLSLAVDIYSSKKVRIFPHALPQSWGMGDAEIVQG
jgi:hypothetical protein